MKILSLSFSHPFSAYRLLYNDEKELIFVCATWSVKFPSRVLEKENG
jgi:hypothetical protein